MKNIKKTGSVLIALVMMFTMLFSTAAYADSEDYISLGHDLTADEQAIVLDFLGVDDLEGKNVNYVTNAEEYQYLGKYVNAAQIGNRALSSVLITNKMGKSIDVEIHNINYCTEDMYRNALATAGVSGVKVIVAGPFEISGTAALVGTIKAYEDMTGEDVTEEVIEACVDELVTTGEVGDEVGNLEAVEAIIAQVKQKLAENPDMTDDEIIEAIRQAAKDAGIELSDANVQGIKNMLSSLKGMDINWENVKQQSESILKNFENVLNSDEAKGFFARIMAWFQSLFGN